MRMLVAIGAIVSACNAKTHKIHLDEMCLNSWYVARDTSCASLCTGLTAPECESCASAFYADVFAADGDWVDMPVIVSTTGDVGLILSGVTINRYSRSSDASGKTLTHGKVSVQWSCRGIGAPITLGGIEQRFPPGAAQRDLIRWNRARLASKGLDPLGDRVTDN